MCHYFEEHQSQYGEGHRYQSQYGGEHRHQYLLLEMKKFRKNQ